MQQRSEEAGAHGGRAGRGRVGDLRGAPRRGQYRSLSQGARDHLAGMEGRVRRRRRRDHRDVRGHRVRAEALHADLRGDDHEPRIQVPEHRLPRHCRRPVDGLAQGARAAAGGL